MWWYPGQDPHHEDLTAQTSAPLAFSHRPASHVLVDVTNQQSTQYVFSQYFRVADLRAVQVKGLS